MTSTSLPPGVRATKTGSFELTISHRLLPKGRAMRNFPSPDDALAYKTRMLQVLNAGVLPSELTRSGVRMTKASLPPQRRQIVAQAPIAASKLGSQAITLKKLLQDYLDSDSAQISKTDRPTVITLMGEIDGKLDGVRSAWVDAWVRHMKRESRLAPGTIRKKVEALARAIAWWNRQHYQDGDAPPNQLRLLPKGYSSYQPDDVAAGEEAPVDRKRDRRLHAGEYEEIEAVLMGKKRADKQRPWAGDDAADFLMMFRLIVHTGLRLREAYVLRLKDISYPLRTIHIPKSKTGAERDVPMTRQVEAWLKEYVEARQTTDIVFPFWTGSPKEEVLTALSNQLSRRFGTLFAHCGCEDLTEHDLRHEATCRWVEKRDKEGRWLFRSEEVQRITGHENAQQFKRYLSLRGSDLADRLD